MKTIKLKSASASRRALGPSYQVEPPSTRGQRLARGWSSQGLSISISITSGFALLIGIFIIYNSFSIAVTQRRAPRSACCARSAPRCCAGGRYSLPKARWRSLIGSA
ncbi:MAG: hypothetical protein U0Q16_07725 [Bryobacteraceae bacterium]